MYEDQSRSLSDYYNDGPNVSWLTKQRQQATVLEKSYSLELKGNDTGGHLFSTGAADLPRTPQQGETFRVKLRGAQTSSIPGFDYGVQDTSNYYQFRLYIPGNELRLFQDGSQVSSAAATLSQNTTYDPQLEWASDGTQTLSLTDDDGNSQSVSMTDTGYSSGEIGWFVGRSDFVDPHLFADHARVV